MNTITDALNEHHRLSCARAAYHEWFDSNDIGVRAIVAGAEWPDRVVSCIRVTDELWNSADAVPVITQALIDNAERWAAEERYA